MNQAAMLLVSPERISPVWSNTSMPLILMAMVPSP
jgi:hypothetical protein